MRRFRRVAIGTVLVALATAAAPAAALEEIGPDDFPISTTGTPGDQSDATLVDVAYNPTLDEYLVVWQADDAADPAFVDGDLEVFAQRVSADGALTGSRVRVSNVGPDATMDFAAQAPAVTFDPTSGRYLVVWQHDAVAGPDDRSEIHGQLLTSTLSEVGPNDFRISDMGPESDDDFKASVPDVATAPGGGEFLVVWQSDDDTGALVDEEYEIYAQRVSTDGAEVGADDVRVSDMGTDGDTDGTAIKPAVAADPVNGRFLVVWHGAEDGEPFEIYGQRLALDASAIGTNDFKISEAGATGPEGSQPQAVAVAADTDAGGFLVTWSGVHAGPNAADVEVWGELLSGAGSGADGTDFRITNTGDDGNGDISALFSAAAYNAPANEWMVTFIALGALLPVGEAEVYAQRLRRDGSEVGPNDARVSTMGTDGDFLIVPLFPALAASTKTGDFLTVWESDNEADDEYEIFGQLVEVPTPPVTATSGYRLIAGDGGTFAFGARRFHGSLGGLRLNAPVVAAATAVADTGQWLFTADGGVFAHGDAGFFGSLVGTQLSAPIVAAAATPTGNGYWAFAADGAAYAFGEAGFHGSLVSTRLSAPIVAAAATPTGNGYWQFAADGAVYALGDAPFFGSLSGTRLSAPIVAAAATPTGNGYWLLATDGGVFAFGDATFQGSLSGTRLRGPIVAGLATRGGDGYWLFAADGGVFAFGDATFLGSVVATPLNHPVVAAI